MPEDLRVNSWLLIPDSELHERFSRSSGPGGQSVNTADSRVELSFDVERSPALPDWARDRAACRLAS
jgi:ribosome-associated protein